MNVRLQLFAAVREAAGCGELELELPPGATIADVRRQLVERLPQLAGLAPYWMFAIDAEYASDRSVIPPGALVACIPPVSGG